MKAVPYNVVGGTNFYSRREIKDMLAYLKTIDNGRDDIAAKRIINVPKRGIGAATIDRVQEYADERRISFFDALCEADQIMTIGRSASKLSPCTDMILAFRDKLKEYGMKELIRDIIETTGYLDYLKDSSDDKDDADERKENVGEFVSKIVSYEETHDEPKLGEFLEEVALIADIDQVGDENDRVLLMTLHSAKGLEFPLVFLVGLEEGLFPNARSVEESGRLEEERRLAYVGITRARQKLVLSHAETRRLHGQDMMGLPSRFLREIPHALLNEIRPKVKVARPYLSPQRRNAGHAPIETPGIALGTNVRHATFGLGTVTDIEGNGAHARVQVNFDEAGSKWLVLAYANLQPA